MSVLLFQNLPKTMLLIDDDAVLPDTPGEEEAKLASSLGESGIHAIDARICSAAGERWLKVARIVFDALEAGQFPLTQAAVELHVRRVLALVGQGRLLARGNPGRPRFSEVKSVP